MESVAATIAEPRRLPAPALVAALFTALLLSYFFVDVPLARSLEDFANAQPRFFDNLFEFTRLFGQWMSILLVVFLVYFLDPARRQRLRYLLIAVALDALAVHFLKSIAGRARPEFYLSGIPMWSFLAGFQTSACTSFPSAHVASAFALAVALGNLYPKGKYVFYSLAFLCGISRVGDLQHYASDAIAGAALGLYIGFGVFRWKWTDRLARRLAA